jgi:hypothetical protein
LADILGSTLGSIDSRKEKTMTSLLIRDLPEQVHRKLRARAKQNRRSLAKEALILLETVLASEEEKKIELPQPFEGQFLLTEEWLDQAKREGRA